MREITIIRPSDMHVHFREIDNGMLQFIAPFTARHMKYGMVMPNTSKPPIRTGNDVRKYREQIKAATSNFPHFEPVMSIKAYDIKEHLTTKGVVRDAFNEGAKAIKIYPKGATTNAHDAVEDIKKLYPAFEVAEELGMIVCIHGEKPDDEEIALEWERLIYNDVEDIHKNFGHLKIVFEHITCASTVNFVKSLNSNVAATITAHHGMVNFNHMAGGMLRPDLFCKPLLKTPQDQRALRKAMTSGNPKFFLGTDSAPHTEEKKYCDHGCAGVFTAPVALSMYAEIFDEEDAMSKFEGYASVFGPQFYGLPLPEEKITLTREEFTPEKSYSEGSIKINNYWGNQKLQWRVNE